MPKFGLKNRLFARSCVDLTSTRHDDSNIMVAACRGSQLVLARDDSARECYRRPDVVHWKRKVGYIYTYTYVHVCVHLKRDDYV